MRIRPPAVAGLFYPAEESELSGMIHGFLAEASSPTSFAKAIIAPHAGYIYSGPTAAFAYKALDADRIRRVVLFGPAHRVPFRGIALPDTDYFETPLGHIPLDKAAMQQARKLPSVDVFDVAHVDEHSLEVHLPFLQSVLDEFHLIPFCIGMASTADVAAVIDALWDDGETAIVISSDLSHYHRYDEARQLDDTTIHTMLAAGHEPHQELDHAQACGATPINGLLSVAPHHHLEGRLLDYRNSGDTSGDRQRVVGYASIGFFEHAG